MRSSASSQPAGLALLLATFRGQLSDACADVTSFPGSSNKPRLRVLHAFDPIESCQGELRADSLHDRKPMRPMTLWNSLIALPQEKWPRSATVIRLGGGPHPCGYAPKRVDREVNTPTAVLTGQRLLMS